MSIEQFPRWRRNAAIAVSPLLAVLLFFVAIFDAPSSDANNIHLRSKNKALQRAHETRRVIVNPPNNAIAGLQPGTWAEGKQYGPWLLKFNGYGTTGVIADPARSSVIIQEEPAVATTLQQTHSALVTSVETFAEVDVTAELRTVRQLRIGNPPNPWEVGWLLWDYTDNTHFYYFIARPDGWELGKETPDFPGNQRFLLTGTTPVFPLGSWYNIRVTQLGNKMTVWVNNTIICSYTDTESPYLSGSVGLYDEDAIVQFARLTNK